MKCFGCGVEKQMGVFTMLIGIPGSGKSTWLRSYPTALVVCPDQIRQWLAGDISDQSQNDVVWKIALYTTVWNLEHNKSVVLDATNVSTPLRKKFLSQLPKDIEKQAIVFETAPEEAIQRIQSDYGRRAKVLPEIVYRMYGEFLYTKQVLKDEGWSEITYIDGGSK
jgi:predicted kinase